MSQRDLRKDVEITLDMAAQSVGEYEEMAYDGAESKAHAEAVRAAFDHALPILAAAPALLAALEQLTPLGANGPLDYAVGDCRARGDHREAEVLTRIGNEARAAIAQAKGATS
jgi:hypothetical protein